MDTQNLRLFVRAADMRNISAAGRSLGMAPAVASTRLAKLETELGADLLRRSTRKVSLSVEGADFLPFAREIIAQEDAAHAALGHGDVQANGTLRFAASSTFAQQYIIPALPAYHAKHPKVVMDLRLSDSQFDLIDGSYDLALRNEVIKDSSLKGRKLARDKRILCASPDYLARAGKVETAADLAQHHLLAFRSPREQSLTTPKGEHAVFAPLEAATHTVIDDGQSLRLAAVAGLGIAINSYWSVHEELATGRLVRVLPTYALNEETALWLVYPKANVLSAKTRSFIDFMVRDVAPTLPVPPA